MGWLKCYPGPLKRSQSELKTPEKMDGWEITNFSFWEGLYIFRGELLVSGRVPLFRIPKRVRSDTNALALMNKNTVTWLQCHRFFVQLSCRESNFRWTSWKWAERPSNSHGFCTSFWHFGCIFLPPPPPPPKAPYFPSKTCNHPDGTTNKYVFCFFFHILFWNQHGWLETNMDHLETNMLGLPRTFSIRWLPKSRFPCITTTFSISGDFLKLV